MAKLGFDISEVAPSDGGGPLPLGIYKFEVVEESLDAAKSGRGEVLSLVFQVCEGEPGAGRKVYERMNVVHESPVAQRIGQADLAALCRAIGKTIEDTEELLYVPFMAEVKHVDEEDKNGNVVARARIKRYLPPDYVAPPAAKERPQRPVAAQSEAAPHRSPASVQRQAVSPGRQGSATGGRSLPWGAGKSVTAATSVDDDIPF